MRKNHTSYSDAMNEWAAKQSGLRKRRNRFLHPDQDLPGPRRALGYLLRITLVVGLAWIVGSTLSAKYFNGSGFNEKLRAEIKDLTQAAQLDSSDFIWQGSEAQCEQLVAQGNDSAFYRRLETTQLSFSLPVLKRLRPSWTIDQLWIEKLSLDLASGSGDAGEIGASGPVRRSAIAAGLLPVPDHQKLTIARVSCDDTTITWGLDDGTRGAVQGAGIDLFGASGDWLLDLDGGALQQNWLRGLEIESLSVRRKGDRLVLSDSEIRSGSSEDTGSLEGEITLGDEPELDLQLELPSVESRTLLSEEMVQAMYFDGLVRLSTQIRGTLVGPAGIETSNQAMLKRGTFSKIPVFEAIDQLLETNSFSRYSPDSGEIEFATGGGVLNVTRFEFKSRATGSVFRGEFTYTAASGSSPDEIRGRLQLGVRPTAIANNELARTIFTERSEGYAWLEITLQGTLAEATRAQQKQILAALAAGSP
ncbi:MAG: hypothetical protein ACR2RV_02470 [Verrucomicrobiales bacterium]